MGVGGDDTVGQDGGDEGSRGRGSVHPGVMTSGIGGPETTTFLMIPGLQACKCSAAGISFLSMLLSLIIKSL